MTTSRTPVALYLDPSTRQWIVRDPEGKYWRLGAADARSDRKPFEISDDANLEVVPGHDRYMLELPF